MREVPRLKVALCRHHERGALAMVRCTDAETVKYDGSGIEFPFGVESEAGGEFLLGPRRVDHLLRKRRCRKEGKEDQETEVSHPFPIPIRWSLEVSSLCHTPRGSRPAPR